MVGNYLIPTMYTISITLVQISLIVYIFKHLHALMFACLFLFGEEGQILQELVLKNFCYS